jgi:hypothetical protein
MKDLHALRDSSVVLESYDWVVGLWDTINIVLILFWMKFDDKTALYISALDSRYVSGYSPQTHQ